jgi:hypothetical protein
MMRVIVSVPLSVADSDYRSWGKWYRTINARSLLSAASRTLIELTDSLSTVLGFAESRARDKGSCSKARKWLEHFGSRNPPIWTSIQRFRQCRRHAVWSRNPIPQQPTWLPGATLKDAGRGGSISSRVKEFSTRKHVLRRRLFQMVASLMANIRFLVAGRYSAVSEGIS